MKSLTGQGETRGVASLYLASPGDNGKAPQSAEPGSACDGPRLLGSDPSDVTGRPTRMPDSFTRPPDDSQQPRRSLRSRWLPKVYLAPVSDGTKLLLVLLAESMNENGYVSVPRDELAQKLGRHKAKVSARLKEAVDARLLDRVVAGHKGTTAVYRAMIPTVQSVPHGGDAKTPKGTHKRDAMDPGNRDAMTRQSVPHGGDATTKATTTEAARSASVVAASTSELRNEKENGNPQAETEHARALRLRAFESWGMQPSAGAA